MGEECSPAKRGVSGGSSQEESGHFTAQDQWQSTAKQLLSDLDGSDDGVSKPPRRHGPERGHRWGGMMPGDSPDANHGDLTRGGLDERGVNLAGVVTQAGAGPHGEISGTHQRATKPRA